MRRPALMTAIFFCLGILAQMGFSFPLSLILVGGCGVWGIGMGCFLCQKSGAGAFAVLGFLIVAAGMGHCHLMVQKRPADHFSRIFTEGQAVVGGQVIDEPLLVDDRQRFVLRVSSLASADTLWHVSGDIQVFYRRSRPVFAYGDQVRLDLSLRRPETARNPGAFDYRAFLWRRGIDLVGFLQHPKDILDHTRQTPWGTSRWLLLVRGAIQNAIDRNLSGGPAGLLKGILLGDKKAVPGAIREAFARCGVNHVLAVSGLHVGLVAGVVFFALKLVGMGRRATAVTTCTALAGYALVTGWPPSAIRACIMGGIALLGLVGERDVDSANALGAAALVLLIAQPQNVQDVGFQLSFAATGGILAFYHPIRGWFPEERGIVARWVFGPLAVSMAAQIATLPLVICYFGLVSVVGLLANLIVVPLIGMSVALGLVTVVASLVWGSLATAFNGANWLVLQGAITVGRWLAQPAWVALEVPPPSWAEWALYASFCALIFPQIHRRRLGNYVVIGSLLLANGMVWYPICFPPAHLEIHLMDVGQGDAILLRFPGGKTMLVDAGPRSLSRDMGERVVLPYLRHLGVSRLDAVVASHGDNDHIGGLETVLRQVDVGHFIDGGQHLQTRGGKRLLRAVADLGIQHHVVAAGDSLLGMGKGGALVLHPRAKFVSADTTAPYGLNNGSVVLRVVYAGRAILLTGDVERETDRDLLAWGDRLRADVLKSAHHGSSTSSSAAFLDGVRPSIVVISCGAGNRFGHPSPEVIARYQERNCDIYRTDLGGAICLRVGETGISVHTQLGP